MSNTEVQLVGTIRAVIPIGDIGQSFSRSDTTHVDVRKLTCGILVPPVQADKPDNLLREVRQVKKASRPKTSPRAARQFIKPLALRT